MREKVKERLPQLDLFRAFAIFCVIQVHASSFAAGWQAVESQAYFFYNWMNIFFRIGTSSFIFLSSFVLFYNYVDKPASRDLIGRFYKKRLTYIILPYLLVSLCYYFVVVVGQRDYLNHSAAELLQSLGFKLLTGSAYTHLYFIFISIQFYILFPLFLWLIQSWKKSRLPVAWIFPIGLAVQWAFYFWNKYDLHLSNKGSYAPSYMSFYMLGAVIAVYFDQIKGWLTTDWRDSGKTQRTYSVLLWASWLIFALVDVQLYYLYRTGAYTATTTVFEVIWNIHLLLSAMVLMKLAFLVYRKGSAFWIKALTRLGELSFAIYLFHPVILLVYRRFRDFLAGADFSVAYFFFIIGGSALALFGSWIFAQFCFKRLPFASLFLGNVPASLKKTPGIKGRDTGSTPSTNVHM